MDINMIREFRAKLNKRAVMGAFSKICDPTAVEIMGHAGFDFVIIDMEHGPNSLETVQGLIRGAECARILPIVRVRENSEALIGRVLDIGACGVQVPQVTTAGEAEKAVHAAKFAPQGMRGICKFVRAAKYSALDRLEYFKLANETLLILQVEGKEALAGLDAMIGIEGLDILFIGLMDLSQSLGVAGHMDHPKVLEKLKDITGKCLKKGVAVGTYADTPAIGKKWIEMGVRYIGCNVDVGIFHNACKSMVQDFDLK